MNEPQGKPVVKDNTDELSNTSNTTQLHKQTTTHTLMTSTFSSVGVMSLSVSSCPSGFCGSTTAMLLSYIQSKQKQLSKSPILDFFLSFKNKRVFLFDTVPCCCASPMCSLTDPDLVERAEASCNGPEMKETR